MQIADCRLQKTERKLKMEDNPQKPKTLKGSMKYFDDDRLEFTPYGQGDPLYEQIRKAQNGTLMRTTGEKKQSLVARLKVAADSSDPAADLRDQLEKLLKGLPQSQREPRPKGRFLKRMDGLTVRLDERDAQLRVVMSISVREVKNVEETFNRMSMEVNKCLHYNSDSLKKLKSAPASDSTK